LDPGSGTNIQDPQHSRRVPYSTWMRLKQGVSADPDPALFLIANPDPGLFCELKSNVFTVFLSNFFLLLLFLSFCGPVKMNNFLFMRKNVKRDIFTNKKNKISAVFTPGSGSSNSN
jgi:hypothetical protein